MTSTALGFVHWTTAKASEAPSNACKRRLRVHELLSIFVRSLSGFTTKDTSERLQTSVSDILADLLALLILSSDLSTTSHKIGGTFRPDST